MPPRSGVKIKLGGRVRTLRFTAHSLGKTEDALGEPLLLAIQKSGQLSIRRVSILLWGGLLDGEPNLTVDEVLADIEPPILPVFQKVMEALNPWIAVNEKEEDKEAGKDLP